MKVYRTAYTVPIPPGTKIVTRKGVHFAKLKGGEARLTKDGCKVLLETAHWHISFEDNLCIRRVIKCFTDRTATRQVANRIEKLLCLKANNERPDVELQKWIEQIPTRIRDELIRFGLIDTTRTAATRPLTEFVNEYKNSLVAKERTPKHISETVSMLKSVFDGCGFKYWTDISPGKVEQYLKDLRESGISYRRSNGLLTATKSFCSWMVNSYFATESPVRHLAKLNAELDRRRERRAATEAELRLLLETTAKSERRFGLTGYGRMLFYRLAAETGLRKNEMRTLRVSAFDFASLTVTVETCYSKHRQKDVLPLRADLAAELQSYVADKLPGARVFTVSDKTADMIKADLADTRIPYRDESGRVCDFHSLRYTFITNLRHAPSRVAQALARHRSSAMTDRYTHIRLQDERAAVESLPDLSQPSRESQKKVKTGTYDTAEILSKSYFSGGQDGTNRDSTGKTPPDSIEKTRFQRARQDSNLQPSDSKSATLSN
jgi:integrase